MIKHMKAMSVALMPWARSTASLMGRHVTLTVGSGKLYSMTLDFIKLAEVHEVDPGSGRVCLVSGREVALFQVDGHFYAVENSCPHRGGRLGDGSLNGAVVTCPRHGWQFDVITGERVGWPGAKIACFPVRVEGNNVVMELSAIETPASADEGLLVGKSAGE